jgi:hypothetical protein
VLPPSDLKKRIAHLARPRPEYFVTALLRGGVCQRWAKATGFVTRSGCLPDQAVAGILKNSSYLRCWPGAYTLTEDSEITVITAVRNRQRDKADLFRGHRENRAAQG